MTDDGDDSAVSAGRVHVRRQEDGAVAGAGTHRNDGADVVAREGTPQLAEARPEVLFDLVLVTGGTADHRQVQERPEEAIPIGAVCACPLTHATKVCAVRAFLLTRRG